MIFFKKADVSRETLLEALVQLVERCFAVQSYESGMIVLKLKAVMGVFRGKTGKSTIKNSENVP